MRALLLIPLGLTLGCNEPKFTQQTLGGQTVPADQLQKGYEAYQQYCRPCHGDNGDGKGYSSLGLRPPPRDFTQGTFKFGGVAAPGLPPDSELKRIVRSGLHGTAMLPWDITDPEVDNTIQYIKTFSPRWTAEKPGEPVVAADPNYVGDRKTQAINLGKKLYHAKAQCSAACHANYVTHQELYDLNKEATGTEVTTFSADMYVTKLKESEYCLEWKPGWKKIEDRECTTVKGADGEEHPRVAKVMPPDFTRDDVRAGTTPADLFRTIGSGVGGAGMPPWKGVLTDEELWGLSYYVRSLVDLKGTAEGHALHAKLADPANLAWVPPAKAPEGAPPAGGAVEPPKPGDAPKPAAPPAKTPPPAPKPAAGGGGPAKKMAAPPPTGGSGGL